MALGRGLGMRALPGNAGTIVLSGSCARLTLYKDLASLSAAASRLSPHHSRLLCEKEVWAGTSRTSTSATFRLPRDGRFLSRAFSSLNCEHKRVRAVKVAGGARASASAAHHAAPADGDRAGGLPVALAGHVVLEGAIAEHLDARGRLAPAVVERRHGPPAVAGANQRSQRVLRVFRAKAVHESLLSDDSIGLGPYLEPTATVTLARGGYEIGG